MTVDKKIQLITVMNTQKEITTQEILSLGLTKNDIDKLLKSNTLERVERGKYRLVEQAHSKTIQEYFEEMWIHTNYEEYDKVLELLNELKDNHSIADYDYNLIKYLLSYSIDLGESHNITYEELEIKDDQVQTSFPNNQIRKLIYDKQLYIAGINYDKISEKDDAYHLIKSLINKMKEKLSKNNEYLTKLIKEKKYNDVIKKMINAKKTANLAQHETAILFLAIAYVTIEKNQTIPVVASKDNIPNVSLLTAIKINDFDLAYERQLDYCKNRNLNPNENQICLIIKDILELIDTLKAKQENINKVNITSIIPYLLKNDFDNAFTTLRKYLISINKLEYEFLVVDLIKISILENNKTYSQVMLTLTQLSNNTYDPNINNYIEEFYIAISNMNSKLAELYLDIIINLNKAMNLDLLTDSLNDVLTIIKNMDNKPQIEDKPIKGQQEEPIIEHKIENNIEQNIEEKLEERVEMHQNIIKKQVDKNLEYENNKKFIEEKLKRLRIRHFIILNPMTNERIDQLIEIINEYDEIKCYKIKGIQKDQLVLKSHSNEEIDLKALYKEADILFKNKKYSDALKIYNRILIHRDVPKAWIYARVGLCYYHLNQPKNSIPYLYMSTYLSERYQDDNFNFTGLIAKIRNDDEGVKEAEEVTKSHPKVSEADFENDIFDIYFGLTNFPEINEYIISKGTNYQISARELGLTAEQIDILTLIYARLFFMSNSVEEGDILLKEYEKSSSKTSKTMNIYKELIIRKRFLSNNGQVDIPLSLKMLP